jgi:hypothetical protein
MSHDALLMTPPSPYDGDTSTRYAQGGGAPMTRPVILVRDWRSTEEALRKARADGTSPILVTPEGAASFHGAGYLGALQERAEAEFPDVAFELIVDCGDAPGHALACLRAGVKRISMSEPNDKIADIARQMGAELVRRPT